MSHLKQIKSFLKVYQNNFVRLINHTADIFNGNTDLHESTDANAGPTFAEAYTLKMSLLLLLMFERGGSDPTRQAGDIESTILTRRPINEICLITDGWMARRLGVTTDNNDISAPHRLVRTGTQNDIASFDSRRRAASRARTAL